MMKMFFLLSLLVFFRVIPHPADFTPVFALMAFILTQRENFNAIWGIMAAWFIADLLLGFQFGTWSVVTYMSILITALNLKLSRCLKEFNLVSAVTVAILFWIYSNLGVWLLDGFYSHNISGLEACYLAAWPFLKNTLAGTLLGFIGIKFCLQRLKKGEMIWLSKQHH